MMKLYELTRPATGYPISGSTKKISIVLQRHHLLSPGGNVLAPLQRVRACDHFSATILLS